MLYNKPVIINKNKLRNIMSKTTKNLTVREVITELQTLPEELLVLTANDEAGTGYRFIKEGYIGLASYTEASNGKNNSSELKVGMFESNSIREDSKVYDRKCVVIN